MANSISSRVSTSLEGAIELEDKLKSAKNPYQKTSQSGDLENLTGKTSEGLTSADLRINITNEFDRSSPPDFTKRRQSKNLLTRRISSVSSASASTNGSFLLDAQASEYRDVKYSEMMTYYEPKWLAIVGTIASAFASLQLPLFGFVLSQYIFLLALPVTTESEIDHFKSERNFWSAMFAILCVGIGLSSYTQKLCFSLGGENLTLNLRVKLFESILRKHIGWFDDKDKAPGVLTNIIQEDISSVNGLTTEAAGILLEAGLGLIVSCGICAIFSW